MKPVLVNVGLGNIESVEKALRFLGIRYETATDAQGLAEATHVILPGVGAFRAGMSALQAYGVVEPLRRLGRDGAAKILGICLGMQLLGEHSEEGDCAGLGLLPFRVEAMKPQPELGIKVPHVGFSSVEGYQSNGLFSELPECADFYFTHSYAIRTAQFSANMGYCTHGDRFVAAFESGLISGAQFHPEKSQANGLRLLRNFFS